MWILTTLGVLLRLVLMFQPEPLWYDEAFSVWLARLPVGNLLAATAGDVHPPAYYLLLRAWLSLWPSQVRVELAARSLSFVLSLAALVLYRRVLQLFDVSVGHRRVAWAVVLFMPALVYYAGEARMYALLMAYILASMVLLGGNDESRVTGVIYGVFGGRLGNLRRLRAGTETGHPAEIGADLPAGMSTVRERPVHISHAGPAAWAAPGEFARGAGGGLCLAGAALTHNAGLIWSAVILGALLWWHREDRPYIARVFIAAGVAVIVWGLVWGPTFEAQLHATQDNYWTWTPNIATVAYMQFWAVFYNAHIPDNGVDSLLMLLVAGLTSWGLFLLARERKHWPLVALAVGFPAAAFVGSHVAGVGMLLHRLLVPGAFFVAIAWGALLIRRDVGRVLAVLLAVAMGYLNILSLVEGRTGVTYEPVISRVMGSGADLIYGNNSSIVPVSLYSGIPAAIFEANPDPMGGGLSDATLAAMGIRRAPLEGLAWSRAWFLCFKLPGSTPDELAYIDHLITAYHGALVETGLGDGRFTEGSLYLLGAQ